ncbi:MAG: hypothetical protein AAF368_20505 [Planctomycetota bacterium]
MSHRERARIVLQNLQYVGNGSAAAGVEREVHARQARFAERRAAYQEEAAGGPFADFQFDPRRGGGGG